MNKSKPIVTCRKHWITLVLPVLAALLFGSIGIDHLKDDITTAAFCLVIAAAFLIPSVLTFVNDYIAVYQNRVIAHKGVIRSARMSTPISKIQNVEISNGLFGKILRYHTVAIDNAGTNGKEFVFRFATHAVKMERTINKLQERNI